MHRIAKANLSVDGGVQNPSKIHSIAVTQGNVVYAQEFARRYGDKIISVSLHPGFSPA